MGGKTSKFFAIISETLQEARVTHEVHGEWRPLKFHTSMISRYSHTIYHNAALGRGPFRAIVHRDACDGQLRKCRHRCGVDETIDHVLAECCYVAGQRRCLRESLRDCGRHLSVAAALGETKVAEDCEKLLASFFGVFKP